MNEQPTHLDLFSGIGGFALAARWAGFRTIGFCEIDKYCQRVLTKNFLANPFGQSNEGIFKQRSGSEWVDMEQNALRKTRWDESPDRPRSSSPIHSDIFTLDGKQFEDVDLITGGFPCQPFSCAGKRRGKEDDRHLWPEMLRVISEARPTWVVGENVTGIIGMELDSVLSDLETVGYATRPFVIPACGVDARHRRNRVWIVAHDERGRVPCRRGIEVAFGACGDSRRVCGDVSSGMQQQAGENLANSNHGHAQRSDARTSQNRSEQRERSIGLQGSGDSRPESWGPEPNVGRVANGIPKRVDRLKGLGNAVVPQVVYQILKGIYQQLKS